MDLKEIKSIIDLMTKNGLSEFEVEKGDFKLRVKRGPTGEWSTSASPVAHVPIVQHATGIPYAAAPPMSAPAAAGASSSATPASAATDDSLARILSPMVGTFYSAPSPESPSFVAVGQQVGDDAVVCIIEAMKVMNEIKAEMKGVIVEALVENGKPVEFGTPLFLVRRA
jgi:acetyl-CoA carboxylase biotin carboxyl carrier protein